MHKPKYLNRPFITAQHANYLRAATLIDAYLYASGLDNKLTVRFDVTVGAKGVFAGVMYYRIELDAFGLFAERRLFAPPNALGAPLTVDMLQALNSAQRAQLRRLIVLLSMSVRAGIGAHRYSTRLHCLQPRACEPLDGIRNHYATSGRAARDNEAARRVRGKG